MRRYNLHNDRERAEFYSQQQPAVTGADHDAALAQLRGELVTLRECYNGALEVGNKILLERDRLREALAGLYADQVDYLTINKLGGMNNHWMVRAREVLGIKGSL